MAPGVSLLRHLQLEVDEHGEGYWVKFDSFIELLKSKHDQRDSIVAIKTSNVHKEINGHRNGLKVISGEEYVSYHSVVKYMFNHSDQLIFCKRVCDQIIHCSLGSSDTVSNIYEIYKAVSHKQLHNKHIETLFEGEVSDLENDIPTLYQHYKIHFKKDEWTRIVEFEFHFSQRYESVLDKTNFEEQIKLRWEFLQELQQTSTLSSVLEAQAKFTITQRTKRIQMYRDCKLPEIVSSLRHNPCLLDDELIKFVQNPSITDIITVDCTKRCTHDSSLHVFIVTSTKHEEVTNIDIPITIQSVRCYLEKYHSSRCDEIIFLSQEDAAKYISEEGFHHRFHLRDDYLVGSVIGLYVWTSNCQQGQQTDTALLPDEESKCSTCFESSREIPLSLEKFNIVGEWCKSVPIHVQLLLEAYINKDYARRCENKENYIKDKIKNLYQLYDSLLHFHNLRYIGVYQERNTEELVLNHKTLDTVFRITSESGATVSLRLADQLIKKKAHFEICYYNTYLRRYSLEYQSSIGIKTGCLNIRDSIMTIMLDNLVKLRYHDDPYPGESRSQQLCTLPITVKGIPPDSSIVDQWHNAENCDGEITCQCKKTTPITKDNYEEFLIQLLPSEKTRLQRFHQLYIWGFCGLWKHVTASTLWKSAMDRHASQINNDTVILEESFASLTLSDGEQAEESDSFYYQGNQMQETDMDTMQEEDKGDETETVDLVSILKQVNEKDIEELEAIQDFDSMFPPLETSFTDDESDHLMITTSDDKLTEASSCSPYALIVEEKNRNSASDCEILTKSDDVAHEFGFDIFKPPPSISKHPPPAVGRDDDINKLRQILDEILLKSDSLLNVEDTHKILFGPDQKIGENMLKPMNSEPKYRIFLLEFPCLHLRKSRITNVCSAYKDAGLLHILKYMRDEDFEDWATLISIQDINKATRYIRRISLGLHVALLSTFMLTLSHVEQQELLNDLLSDRCMYVSEKWNEKYANFIDTATIQNATFALHVELLRHCDEICALALAERAGGVDGYTLMLAAVKSSLGFAFMNGASSYAPYCTQLLKIHYESGIYYQNMKASLFSTPHKNSRINFAVDCQREMDHKDVIKAFRSGSSLEAVIPRMSLVDSLESIKDSGVQDSSVVGSSEETEKGLLGLDITETDNVYILRVAALVIRQGGLSVTPCDDVYNVYSVNKTLLPSCILDRNTNEVGGYLIKKYIASQQLFSVSKKDLPNVKELNGPSNFLNRVRLAKGVTIKRVTNLQKGIARSERGIREEKRKKIVTKEKKRIDCLSSDMNLCQAVVKPDCSKPKVQKSAGVQKALTELMDKYHIVENSTNQLVFINTKTVPSVMQAAALATVEFAGIKFKTKAISIPSYMKYIEVSILKNIMKMLPGVRNIVVCEEKYRFTPDSFKAATRSQRTTKEKYTINHLKTPDEMLGEDKFDRSWLVTTAEGKCLISTFLARNAKTLRIPHDLNLYVDSELHIEGCHCNQSDRCSCKVHAVPLKYSFTRTNDQPDVSKVEEIKQRKGEAELAQIDWLLSLSPLLHDGQPCVSFVTSGDIDALVLHLFTVAHCWARKSDGSFRNPVYVVLNKKNGQMDIYNITGLLEAFERVFGDKDIGMKLAVGLSLGGNDYLPRFHNINHTAQLLTFFENSNFRQGLITCIWEGQSLSAVRVNKEIYKEFIKALYCPKSLDWNKLEFDEVRQISIQTPLMSASGSFRSPQLWMPPAPALEKLAIHIDCLLQYYLTAGKHQASLPDFLSAGSLKKMSTGEIEYNLGQEIFTEDISQLLVYTKESLSMKMKLSSKVRKRKQDQTPQKGQRKKSQRPSTSTPRKPDDRKCYKLRPT